MARLQEDPEAIAATSGVSAGELKGGVGSGSGPLFKSASELAEGESQAE